MAVAAAHFGFNCKPEDERQADKLATELMLACLAYEDASRAAFTFSGHRRWVILY